MTDRWAADSLPTEEESVMLSELVATLQQAHRTIGTLQALEAQLLSAAVALAEEQASRGPAGTVESDLPLRSIAAELAAALRVSDRTVQRRLSDAHVAVDRFPAAVTALAEGRISRAHLSVIVDAGIGIDDAGARATYEARAIDKAAHETPGRLRAIARALAEEARSTSIDERYAEARRLRRVVVTDLDDGMAELLAVLPAALAHGIHDRLTRMAHATTRQGASVERSNADGGREAMSGGEAGDASPAVAVTDDPRCIDERRADLLCDLALTGLAHGHGDGLEAIAASVQVTVPVTTLALGEGRPAVLGGHGPIDRDTAARLSAAAPAWDRVLTDASSGAVVAVDRYRPSEDLRRFLRARDERCRFPGCGVSARRSDLDHTKDAAWGGPTEVENLAHLCRRHHVLKHQSAWSVEQAGGGVLRWTSPTRRVYLDAPAPMVRFVADDPPPF
ncbi:DUF222 domain-containing protein [Microbacterium sp. 1P10UB]|uniref:HNH endonuclease signature motif containing protein n=1 Tax=unclassified Microbacterium TaxID=2609290 RepID=UPI0039A3B12C